jgi:hypothetical protein
MPDAIFLGVTLTFSFGSDTFILGPGRNPRCRSQGFWQGTSVPYRGIRWRGLLVRQSGTHSLSHLQIPRLYQLWPPSEHTVAARAVGRPANANLSRHYVHNAGRTLAFFSG